MLVQAWLPLSCTQPLSWPWATVRSVGFAGAATVGAAEVDSGAAVGVEGSGEQAASSRIRLVAASALATALARVNVGIYATTLEDSTCRRDMTYIY